MSKVVFVGNVPYNMGEDQLIDVFKSVGQVVGFRLVFDRDTGKPRGYGFCEFAVSLSSTININLVHNVRFKSVFADQNQTPKPQIIKNTSNMFEHPSTLFTTLNPLFKCNRVVQNLNQKTNHVVVNVSSTCENNSFLVPHNPYWLEKDHETALSAVRNLNNTDVGGRPLRIDLADSDPFLEGKTTVRGEIIDGGTPGPSEPRHGWRGGGGDSRHESIFANLPPGIQIPQGASALDYISQTLATMQPSQLMEVLAQMKAFVITHPEQARTLLSAHPQFAYALFQSLVLNKIVDSAILQRMLAATTGGTAPPQAARPPVPPPHLQQPQHPQYPPPIPPQAYPPPPLQQPPIPTLAPPPAPTLYGHHVPPPHVMPPPPMAPYGYRPPPPAQPMVPPPQTQASQLPTTQTATPAAPPGISDDQRAMIMQVFALTQEQINAFPEAERAAIQQLRTQYSQLMNGVGA